MFYTVPDIINIIFSENNATQFSRQCYGELLLGCGSGKIALLISSYKRPSITHLNTQYYIIYLNHKLELFRQSVEIQDKYKKVTSLKRAYHECNICRKMEHAKQQSRVSPPRQIDQSNNACPQTTIQFVSYPLWPISRLTHLLNCHSALLLKSSGWLPPVGTFWPHSCPAKCIVRIVINKKQECRVQSCASPSIVVLCAAPCRSVNLSKANAGQVRCGNKP